MGTSRASRPIPLALTMLVALFSALAALAVAGGHDAAAHGDLVLAQPPDGGLGVGRISGEADSSGIIKQFPARFQ